MASRDFEKATGVPRLQLGVTRSDLYLTADSDEAGHAFQSEAGHPFQIEAGHGSDLKPAT